MGLIQSVLIKYGFATSRSDARRTVDGGGVSIDGEKIQDPFFALKAEDFGEGRVIRKGKKNFSRIIAK